MVAGNIPGKTQTMAIAIFDATEAGNQTLALTLVLVISAVALAILTLANRLEHNGRYNARIRKNFPPARIPPASRSSWSFKRPAGVTVLFGPSGVGQDPDPRFHRRLRASGRRPHFARRRHLFDGATSVHLPPQARNCGYVFQNYASFHT